MTADLSSLSHSPFPTCLSVNVSFLLTLFGSDAVWNWIWPTRTKVSISLWFGLGKWTDRWESIQHAKSPRRQFYSAFQVPTNTLCVEVTLTVYKLLQKHLHQELEFKASGWNFFFFSPLAPQMIHRGTQMEWPSCLCNHCPWESWVCWDLLVWIWHILQYIGLPERFNKNPTTLNVYCN